MFNASLLAMDRSAIEPSPSMRRPVDVKAHFRFLTFHESVHIQPSRNNTKLVIALDFLILTRS